jgi:predicted nucleic acid-binding protein
MLLDSNIIIYAAKPAYPELRRFIEKHTPAVSAVSYVEVLGYHRLTHEERRYFEEFFAVASLLPISEAVLNQAVRLRQTRKMSVADALQAGTALAHRLTLVTRNTKDFEWIEGISLLNPFDATSP